MIVDSSDPTGIGLFSKCARSHASRTKPNYRPGTAQCRPKSHTEEPIRKKPRSRFGFQKQLSREQRDKTFKKEDTPPVGQYNPVVKKQSKLVWDILKAHTTSKKHQDHKTKQHIDSLQRKNQVQKMVVNQDQTIIQAYSSKLDQLDEAQGKPLMKSVSPSFMQSNNNSQCMVNMSRMTGRKEETLQSMDWGQSDVMHSLQYIKGSISKNIDFGRIKREKKRRGTMNFRSYDYDLNKVRPTQKGLIDFSVTKGREQRRRQNPNNYSYQHYEYDSYVWQSSSNVYPNTKTHVVDFTKQINRYKNQSERQ